MPVIPLNGTETFNSSLNPVITGTSPIGAAGYTYGVEYTTNLLGGDADVFAAPHWVRVRVLEPETLAEQPPGKPGLLAVFDLANVGSVPHLLTADLGLARSDGFELLGRAGGAELRGCSLTVEELAGG